MKITTRDAAKPLIINETPKLEVPEKVETPEKPEKKK